MLRSGIFVLGRDARLPLAVDTTGLGDGHPAVQAAVRAGGTVYLPDGTILMNDDLHVDLPTKLVGEGWRSTTLRFAEGKGVIIHRATTSPQGTNGEDAVIRDLTIAAASAGVSGRAGVSMYARAELSNVIVSGFSGHGIEILGGTGKGPAGENTNANRWLLSMVQSNGNLGSGVFVDGGDSNAGVGFLVDCVGNGGDGIWDDSFLGNVWVQCHTAANTGRAYHVPYATTSTVLVGCYSEGGQQASLIGRDVLSLGGKHGAGFDAASTGASLIPDSGLQISTGIILRSPDATRYRITVANGGALAVTAV